MKREDVIKLMSVLRGAYPQFYRDVGRQEALDTISLWTDMFAEDDAAIVAAAVKALIATDSKGYPPHIGAVKAKIRQLTERPKMAPQGLGVGMAGRTAVGLQQPGGVQAAAAHAPPIGGDTGAAQSLGTDGCQYSAERDRFQLSALLSGAGQAGVRVPGAPWRHKTDDWRAGRTAGAWTWERFGLIYHTRPRRRASRPFAAGLG